MYRLQKRGPHPEIEAEKKIAQDEVSRFVRRAWLIALPVAAAVVAVDQFTKTWAEHGLADRVVSLPGSVQLALAYNQGVAFGLGRGIAPLLVGFAVVGLVVAMAGKHITVDGPSSVGAGLLLGGSVGNVCDRLFRGHGGAVVDFIDLRWWPVFNVADSAIVVGAVILVLWGSRRRVLQ